MDKYEYVFWPYNETQKEEAERKCELIDYVDGEEKFEVQRWYQEMLFLNPAVPFEYWVQQNEKVGF